MENKLQFLAEFQSLLKNYRISSNNLAILRQAKLVLLVGPTSSGRNTIIEELVKSGDYYHIVSDTTRAQRLKNGRPIEQNGREYWFRGEAEVLADLRAGQYMEAAIIHAQQVSGCNIRELELANRAGQISIKDIDPQGAATIKAAKKDTIIIFVLPPSYDEWLHRMRGRGQISSAELKRRLDSARQELAAALASDYYQFIINSSLTQAVRQVAAIAAAGRQQPSMQSAGRQLAQDLQQTLQTIKRSEIKLS
ncbi:MAG: guanylate kinase [Candidatus Saccharimonadales bacterium]